MNTSKIPNMPPIGQGVNPPPPGVFQYVGARYVPMFADPVEWQDNTAYEPLTIVTYNRNSYTSRQPVPAGINPTNANYWVLTGNYNAQLDDLSTKIDGWDEQIQNNTATASAAQTAAAEAEKQATAAANSVESLSTTVGALQDTVKNQGEDITTNTNDIKTNTDGIAQLTQDVDQLQKDVDQLQEDVAAFDPAEITTIKTTLETHSAQIETLQENVSGLTNTANDLVDKVNTHTNQIKTLTDGLTEANQSITNNTATINAVESTANENKEKLDTIDPQQIETNKENIETLTSSLSTVTSNVESLTETVNSTASQIQEVKDQSDAATEEVNRLSGIVGDDTSGLIKDFNDLKEAVESGDTAEALAGRVGLLENQVGKPATETEPATGIEKKIADLKATDETTAAALESLQTNDTALNNSITALQTVTESNTSDLTALKTQVGKPATETESATGIEKKIADLQAQVGTGESGTGLTERVTTLETTVGDASSGLVKSVADNAGNIANLTNNLESLTTQVNNQSSSISANSQSLTNLSGRVANVESGVTTATSTANAANEAAQSAQTTANSASEAAQAASSAAANALPLSGGTMTGSIVKAGEFLRNNNNLSQATAFFARETISGIPYAHAIFGIADYDGDDTISSVPTNPIRVTGIANPQYQYDAANKAYVDAKAGGNDIDIIELQSSGTIPAYNYNKKIHIGVPVNQVQGALGTTGSSIVQDITWHIFIGLTIKISGARTISNCIFIACSIDSNNTGNFNSCTFINCTSLKLTNGDIRISGTTNLFSCMLQPRNLIAVTSTSLCARNTYIPTVNTLPNNITIVNYSFGNVNEWLNNVL